MIPFLFPFYILITFALFILLFCIFDEGYLATKIRYGLNTTFSEKLNTSQIINLSGYLLLFLSVAGFFGWAVTMLQINLVFVFFISFLGLLGLSIIYTRRGRGNLNYDLLKTILYIVTSFFFGACLFGLNYYWQGIYGNTLLGITELLGIWLLVNWGFMVITNYAILKIMNFGLNIVFLIPYFTTQLNIFEFFGINFPIFQSRTLFFALPLIIFCLNCNLYGKLQMKKKLPPQQKNEYLLSGLSAFFTLGGVYLFGYLNYYNDLLNSLSDTNLEYLFGITTLWLFGTDYICKRIYKNYNANFLVPILVLVSGFFSFIISPQNPFVPMLLTSIGFMIYMMADYLRKNSPITGILFYLSFCSHLLIITFSQDFWSLFLLIVDLLILIYAALLHIENKFFIYFVSTVVPLTLSFRLFGVTTITYLSLGLIGVIMLLVNKNLSKKVPQKISKA